jgi:hypothetical protein
LEGRDRRRSLQPPCVLLTLHEIAIKIASKYLANARP